MAKKKQEVKVEPVKEPEGAADDSEEVTCPVCGKHVGLDVLSCPHCGAEFEAEAAEVEDAVQEEPAEEEYSGVDRIPIDPPTSITDLRVIGVSLIVLGIIGSQISFFIDWYWSWVPPIEDNLGMFLGIAAVVVVIGLLVFMLYKRSATARKAKKVSTVPGGSLSIFLFGIIALVMVMLWDPINTALQNQSTGVAIAFIAAIIVGVIAMLMCQ